MHRWIDTQHDNARNLLAAPKNQIAKVLVFGKQDSPFGPSPRHDFRISHRRCDFRYVEDVVAATAQVQNQTSIDTFIGKPTHG